MIIVRLNKDYICEYLEKRKAMCDCYNINNCNGCKFLNTKNGCCDIITIEDDNPKRAISIVEDWANYIINNEKDWWDTNG